MKKKRTVPFFVIFFIFSATAAELTMAYAIEDFDSVFPAEVNGWKKVEPTATYDKTNLFDYIDGGAELYISYNFKKLLAVRYKGKGDEEIVIDIFDMGDSFNAFGVFSHGREREDGLVGQGSEYGGGLLTFWKDRYYISVMAYPETKEKKELVLEFGRKMAAAIPREGALPPVLELLPKENLVRDSIRYFHHYIWLNSHFFVSNDNILQIDDETQAVLAKYRMEGMLLHLLLALYPEPERAKSAGESFLRHYLPDAKNGMAQLPDGRWTGRRTDGRMLSIIFNAPDKDILTSYFEMIKPAANWK
ncbi:MAG: hypothetical protein JXE07_00575 [Candidatus Aminicenantes bacterium]|nr:hypothetical protein [Candidatus Aminicenantes bacterium]